MYGHILHPRPCPINNSDCHQLICMRLVLLISPLASPVRLPDVTVSNVISSLSTDFNVTVLYPDPGDLQMTLNGPDLDFPSCVPRAFANLTEDLSADSSAVFVDTEVRIECLLLNGAI